MQKRVLEEEYQEALEKWLNENPDKTINDIIQRTVIVISNGKEIKLGQRISTMRRALKNQGSYKLSNEQQDYWVKKYGLNCISATSLTEKEYREALEIWLNENPGKTVNDVMFRTEVTISSGRSIKLGKRIHNLCQSLKNQGRNKMSLEQKDYWLNKHGLYVENLPSEEEYQEALEKWLSENEGKTINDIIQRTEVVVSSGKIVKLGKRITYLRQTLKGKYKTKITEEQKKYWVEKHGLVIDVFPKEEEYHEALEIWLSENTDKTINEIPANTEVVITNGKIIALGNKLNRLRQSLNGTNNIKITEEQKEYWVKEHGLIPLLLPTEEEYQEALEIWLSENVGKTVNDVTQRTIVTISNGKKIKLGKRITSLRQALKQRGTYKISDKQKEYWIEEKGLVSFINVPEKEYHEALEIWLRENPGKTVNDIKVKTEVVITSGKTIKLGEKVRNLKLAFKMTGSKKLTEVQKEYWVEKYGLTSDFTPTEEEYREALELWLKENPSKTINDISQKVEVIISTGKKIRLGQKINHLRQNMKENSSRKLSIEQQTYWVEKQGLSSNVLPTEEEFREALEIWLRKNKGKTINDIPYRLEVVISSGRLVKLGQKVKNLRKAIRGVGYNKMNESQEKYWVELYGLRAISGYNLDFDGDLEKTKKAEKCLETLKEKRKSNRKEEFDTDNILKEFNIDIETLNHYLTRTKGQKHSKKGEVLKYKDKTLRSFCIENGYNYEVVAYAIKLHEFCEDDDLEKLIEKAIINYNQRGQKKPATWVYEKYGNLVKDILLYLRLDWKTIFLDMSNYLFSLEEAIRHDIFRRSVVDNENKWLEELYNSLVEEIKSDKEQSQTINDVAYLFVKLKEEYNLNSKEVSILWNVLEKYIKTMRNYQIVDVGLETNSDKKQEKIKLYNLDNYDIEESFFIPLEFDKGVLLGRSSELYKRRQLLRQYIIDWNEYSDIEKEVIIEQNNFTKEEICYINNTRRDIDVTTKSLVKK